VLDHKTPAMTLNRLQSAIGLLMIDSAPGTELACAYEFTDGDAAFLGPGFTTAPANSRTPVLATKSHSVAFDLRQVCVVSRLLVLAAFPSARRTGLITVTSWDGSRLDVPLDQPSTAEFTVVLSIHNVDGELVLRAEDDHFGGSARAACEAFGFTRLVWAVSDGSRNS
jgi:hypothetical protein